VRLPLFAEFPGEKIVDEALSRLGLRSDPFDDVVVDDLFFAGAGRGALVDELVHQVRYGEDLCLVSGDAGIGKTRLWHHLQQLAPTDTICVAMQAQLFLNAEQFVALCLGDDDEEVLDEDFEQHLQTLAEHKRQHWLLIDDAQELHDSLYKKIAQWMTQFSGTLRVVLFADLTLKYRLQNPALNFPLSCWEMQPLSPAEIAEYLMYRLRHFGWHSEELPFTAPELDQICRHSEGVPLHIHDVAVAVLQKNDEVGAPPWRKLLAWPYLHVGLLLLAASTLTVVWIGGGTGSGRDAEQPVGQVSSEIVHPLAEKAPEQNSGQVVTSAAPGEPAVIEFRNTIQPAPQSAAVAPASTVTNAPPPIADTPAKSVVDNAGVRVHPQADAGLAVQGATSVTPPRQEPAAAPRPAATTTASAPAPVIERSAVPAAKTKPVSAPNVQSASNLQASILQRKDQKPASIKPQSEVKPKPQNKPVVASALGRMSPQHYVVQLIAATDPARLASFRASLPSGLPLASYQRITSGQRWHVLVYGDFSSIAQARAAINQLPALAREQKPWAKPVAQVHKEMATIGQ